MIRRKSSADMLSDLGYEADTGSFVELDEESASDDEIPAQMKENDGERGASDQQHEPARLSWQQHETIGASPSHGPPPADTAIDIYPPDGGPPLEPRGVPRLQRVAKAAQDARHVYAYVAA